jgi:hypothetical protein
MRQWLRQSRAWPRGFLASILAILVIESSLVRHDLHWTRPEATDWRFARHNARVEGPRRELLVLGTSMAQQGVVAPGLERATGLHTYNLAVCGGTCLSSLTILRQAIAAGSRPVAVALDVHPGFLTSAYSTLTTPLMDLLTPGELMRLAWTESDPIFLAQVGLSKALPSLYYRPVIRAVVADALKGKHTSHAIDNLVYAINRRHNAGSLLIPKLVATEPGVRADFRAMLGTKQEPLEASQRRALVELLDLAAAHDIRVYWLIMPLAPPLQELRAGLNLDAAYDQLIQPYLDRYPNLVVVDGRRSEFPESAFLDNCHLSSAGA